MHEEKINVFRSLVENLKETAWEIEVSVGEY
jgi:hypothetical protein